VQATEEAIINAMSRPTHTCWTPPLIALPHDQLGALEEIPSIAADESSKAARRMNGNAGTRRRDLLLSGVAHSKGAGSEHGRRAPPVCAIRSNDRSRTITPY